MRECGQIINIKHFTLCKGVLYFRDLPAPEKATNPEEAPPTVAGGPIKVGPAGAAAVGLELLLREEVRDDEGEGAGEVPTEALPKTSFPAGTAIGAATTGAKVLKGEGCLGEGDAPLTLPKGEAFFGEADLA